MASPFSVFRRNQKILLALGTVMIMLVFVIGDPLMKYISPHRGGQNPVVATTKARTYHQMDLVMLIQSRKVVENFLQLLASEFVQKVAMAGQVSRLDITYFATSTYENWRQQLLSRVIPPGELPPTEDNEQARARAQEEAQAIQTMLLADRAEAQGMMISDQTVNDYLKSLTRNMITGDEFQRIVSKLHAESGGVTQSYLFDALRRELLASRYSMMFWMANNPVPPAPRWTYFQRLNRRATAEVLGVPAEKLLKEVPEPKESELLAFFDAHNQTIQVPDSPEPGFKQPAKAAFQFFKAKYTDFLELAQKEVTTEAMQEYYEKNKDIRFREREKPADEAAAPGDDTGAGSEKPDTEKPDATKPDAAKPDAAKPDAGKTDAGKTDGADKPAAGADKPAPPADAGQKKSSSTRTASPFRPVALAQKSADAPAADDSATKPAPPAGGQNTPAEPASSAAAASEAKPDGQSADAEEQEKPTKPELKYEPFEKVEGEIRKILAEEKTNKMVDEIFGRLTTKMREYAAARGRWEANREEDPSAEAPEPLDLPALASAEGLTAGETGLVSAVELRQSGGLGQSYANVRTPYDYQRISFVDVGFNERLLRPMKTQDDEGDSYLAWKTKELPSAVPTLDEVRQEVVRAFKMIEARKRAAAAAEQLAKEAREAKKPLTEVFAGREEVEVVNTGPFTWMTIGAVPFDPNGSQPRLSPVHGVEAPGEDFMRAVFDSTPDQIRVVLNQPQTIAYVVEVKEFLPDRAELEQQFITEDFRKYGQLAFDVQRNLYLDWLRWLDGQAGLTWADSESTPARTTR